MAPRPYKQICISIYLEDDDRLVEKVEELRRAGITGANKSKVVRWALEIADVEEIIKRLEAKKIS
jgi:hypothetical protein